MMSDEDVVMRFKDIVGVGTVRPLPMKDGRRACWRWRLSSTIVVGALFMLFEPWLGERRKQQYLNSPVPENPERFSKLQFCPGCGDAFSKLATHLPHCLEVSDAQ